ncbi:TPA: hypothetical protein VAQ21_001171 [Streptococcus agalactiae]|nr:hypothetical protein [Streptococcus agalactiae]
MKEKIKIIPMGYHGKIPIYYIFEKNTLMYSDSKELPKDITWKIVTLTLLFLPIVRLLDNSTFFNHSVLLFASIRFSTVVVILFGKYFNKKQYQTLTLYTLNISSFEMEELLQKLRKNNRIFFFLRWF